MGMDAEKFSKQFFQPVPHHQFHMENAVPHQCEKWCRSAHCLQHYFFKFI